MAASCQDRGILPGRRLPRSLGAALALILAATAPGCSSIKKSALRTVADHLSSGSSSLARDDDPELIKEALPFGLKTLEGLSEQLPRHRPLLRSLASGFTSYAAAFILPEVRSLELADLNRAREEQVRARRMCLRARDYGLRSLEAAYPGLREELLRDPRRALARTTREDVPDLYWTAAAWGTAISIGKDQMDLVADLPAVQALITRAAELDEAWEEGAIHEFLIAFESRGRTMGGSLERAREHYTRALELSRGYRISPHVTFAESVCIQTQDRKEFDRLLDLALAFDADRHLETRLPNLLAQRKARRLKALAGDLFLEEAP